MSWQTFKHDQKLPDSIFSESVRFVYDERAAILLAHAIHNLDPFNLA